MSVRISPSKSSAVKIQFVLSDAAYSGPVSAVGTFNDWTPGKHKLVKRSNGTRSVTIEVPAGEPVTFRYLADGGVWFDDPDAHEITHEGSRLLV